MSLESAVMTEPVAVALQTIFDNMPQPDEKVLVIGGGVIGNLIIQAIRALVPGCSISLIEPSSFAADLAKKAGADEVIPSKDVFDIPSDNGMIISLFWPEKNLGRPELGRFYL